MAAALDGIDALVFTGGIGENSPRVRSEACGRLGFLGLEVDRAANEGQAGDRSISRDEAPAQVLVVAAREDLEIAAGVRAVLADAGP